MTEDLTAGGTCAWCEGTGYTIQGRCGWCDGTTVQKPNYEGCTKGCEHRTCGPIRAWCMTHHEWCYADDPCGPERTT